MVKKLLAAAVVLLVMVSGARAETGVFSSHRSIVDFVDGKPDYSTARFLSMWVEALGYDNGQATQEDVNLTGSITFSGGDYSFWDSKNGMRHISGASHTFGLAAGSWVNVGSTPEYVPMTASGDNVVFCLEADGGLNGVNVSWSFPDKPEYNGTGTVPHYRTTQSQLESYVPYVEYVRSGSQVTGLRWRIVNPDNTSEAVSLDFAAWFRIASVWDADGNTLYSGSWADIEAGNPAQGEATFDSPIDEADISRIRFAFNRWNEGSENSYQWYFCKPSEPEPWLYENHTFTASLVNGKSDYSNVKSDRIFFDVRVNRGIIAEAKHFTADASMTIPGGGYSLSDNDTLEDLGVTVPVGTDKTFKLRMYSGTAPGDSSVEYQPIDENGVKLHFEGGAEGGGENLVGRTITWTFPEYPSLSGSAKVSSFKSAAQFLATAVPYVELVSADGKLTAVNFRMVASSDTSTALTLPYRTNFRIRFYRIVPDEVEGEYYRSSWMYNTSSGTWTLDKPQDLSNMDRISVRLWSWEEDAEDPLRYQWEFYPASAPAPLSITTATLPSGLVNATYTATIAANLPGATWSVSSGTLPAGLTLNPTTGTISGTPTTAGTATFTVTATLAGHDSASKTFTLTVSQTPTPQTVEITTTTIPDAIAGMPYNATLASNPEGATWTLTGNLPAGLTLDSSGRISGTPTVSGNFTFTVTARYGTASDVRTGLTLTVAPLEITTETLPGGTVGGAYNETLSSNGSGLTWTVSAGTLPAGLTLNENTGLLSGTLTEAGEYTFTVYAHNTHASASRQYTVSVQSNGTGGGGGGCSSFPVIIGATLLAVILKRR